MYTILIIVIIIIFKIIIVNFEKYFIFICFYLKYCLFYLGADFEIICSNLLIFMIGLGLTRLNISFNFNFGYAVKIIFHNFELYFMEVGFY